MVTGKLAKLKLIKPGMPWCLKIAFIWKVSICICLFMYVYVSTLQATNIK